MRIVIIGAGNVANLFAKEFNSKRIKVVQIIGREITHAQKLSQILDCDYSDDIDEVLDADLYIIAVPDKEIMQVALNKKLKDKFIVHTSGSVEMNVLSENTEDFGVFYPLQTLNKNIKVDFSKVPICIEASNLGNYTKLEYLAGKISENIYKIDSLQRKKMHIAAVFVNNFVNHLFVLASQIVEKENVNPEILKPLISQTFENIQINQAFDIQTGPAKRQDFETIENHLKALKLYPKNFEEVYNSLTNSIISTYKN